MVSSNPQITTKTILQNLSNTRTQISRRYSSKHYPRGLFMDSPPTQANTSSSSFCSSVTELRFWLSVLWSEGNSSGTEMCTEIFCLAKECETFTQKTQSHWSNTEAGTSRSGVTFPQMDPDEPFKS